MPTIEELQRTAQELRITILRMNHRAGSGHTGGSFSVAEIITVLYDKILNVLPHEPKWDQRDRFVLSKGHAAPALYGTLARKGFCEPSLLDTLRKCGSPLQGHVYVSHAGNRYVHRFSWHGIVRGPRNGIGGTQER